MPIRNALLAEAAADRSLYALAAANLAALAIALCLGHDAARDAGVLDPERGDRRGERHPHREPGAIRCVRPTHERPAGSVPRVRAFDAGNELGAPGGYLLCTVVFIANHGYSLVHNIRRDAQGRPSIGALMFLPYARILPMHLTILFGDILFSGTLAFILFGALKTAADLIMHTLEHHLFQHAEQRHAQA